jgi:hypothetical protein
VTASFYVDADMSVDAEKLIEQELNSGPVQRLIGDTVGDVDVHHGEARQWDTRHLLHTLADIRAAAGACAHMGWNKGHGLDAEGSGLWALAADGAVRCAAYTISGDCGTLLGYYDGTDIPR